MRERTTGAAREEETRVYTAAREKTDARTRELVKTIEAKPYGEPPAFTCKFTGLECALTNLKCACTGLDH